MSDSTSCEFYERLAAGPLGRLLKERGDRFFKVVKLLAGGLSFVSSLAELAELVADLSRPGLAGELVELIKAAKSAGQCDEEVKRAAERLGVGEEWLRTLAKNLAALPEIDLSQLEERARALERGLDLLKRLSPHILDLTQLFVEEGGYLLVNSPFGVVEYVEVGVEDEVRQALSRGRVVVVYGPRGVGKSTAALKAIYDFAKAQLGRAVVVVRVGENWKEAISVAKQLKEPFVPVLYYDTLEAGGYRRRGEGVDVMYSAMAYAKPLADFLHDAALLRVPTVVVLTEEDYRAHEGVVKRVGAEAVRLGGEAEALVRGILRGVPNAVAETVLERYRGEFYAVAAALAKALYEEWRDPARVADAVKRLDVHSLALAYLWHVVLGGDEEAARRAAPLILATGFFGPHPPKLAKAVVETFGREPDSAVVKWLSQPLHGTLYETIRKVAHGAVYRRLGMGDDELCQGSNEGPCRLVEICAEVLEELSCEKCNAAADVKEEYAKWVAKRFVNALKRGFLQVYSGVDELDILSALYGLAVLPGWDPQLKQLEGWFFASGKKVKAVSLYLYSLLRERGEELTKKVVAIAREVERRGYTIVDLWRAVGIAAAGQWESATDEELGKAVKLSALALHYFATAMPIVLGYSEPLFSEAWHRIVSKSAHGNERERQRLANWLTVAMYNATKGHPLSLLHFFTIGIDRLDLIVVAQRFEALYNATSNAGKLRLLDMLLHTLRWDFGGVNVAAMLLGNPQLRRWKTLVEVAKRVEEFVSHLDGVERTYAVARLYPRLAALYASFGDFVKMMELAKEALNALKELQKAHNENKILVEEKLRPYLELKWISQDLGREFNALSRRVHYNLALAYMDADELDVAMKHATTACESAEKLSSAYDEVLSCSLLLRLRAIQGGALRVEESKRLIEDIKEEFKRAWQKASQNAGQLGVEAVATILGNYVIALVSASHLGEVERVLKEWGWVLDLDPMTSALTYGVLSLFDERHLKKAMEQLSGWARANLQVLADVLHNAIEAGLFAKDSEIVELAERTLSIIYGKDVVTTLFKSDKLFLSALIGLAYCMRGEGLGLKLAKAAARAGSRLNGLLGRLFGELYKALEGVAVGNCLTDEVLRAVYKLYYYHV